MLSFLGYGHVRPNAGATGDNYHDTYCLVQTNGAPVNTIELTTDEGHSSNYIRAYFLRCSYSNEYCYTLDYFTSSRGDGGRHTWTWDMDDCYYIDSSPNTDYYYMVEIRMYDYNEGDSYYPRAYWVGLAYDTEGESCGESASGAPPESDDDPFPECAEGCYEDCSFLSHPADEFWDSVDWELDWRDYCRDPSLEQSLWETAW